MGCKATRWRACWRTLRSRWSYTPGRQDIALLRRALDCDVRTCSTRRLRPASSGCRRSARTRRLLVELLGVRLAKSASFTRWDTRPLSPEQLSYAREDVVHLTALATELERRLEQAGRLQWAREECEFLERVSDERDLDAIFARLPRVRGMNTASQGDRARTRDLARADRRRARQARAERARRCRAGRDGQAQAVFPASSRGDSGRGPGQSAQTRRGAARRGAEGAWSVRKSRSPAARDPRIPTGGRVL